MATKETFPFLCLLSFELTFKLLLERLRELVCNQLKVNFKTMPIFSFALINSQHVAPKCGYDVTSAVLFNA